jgi:hypothetical protein
VACYGIDVVRLDGAAQGSLGDFITLQALVEAARIAWKAEI